MTKDLNQSETDSADWNAALAAVNRLAGARKSVRAINAEAGNANEMGRKPTGGVDQDPLTQAHEDIEKAAAALRTVQPELSTWSDDFPGAHVRRRRAPVFFLIGLIWAGMVAVVITAIQAVKSLM